jgi:hypothetical protein
MMCVLCFSCTSRYLVERLSTRREAPYLELKGHLTFLDWIMW